MSMKRKRVAARRLREASRSLRRRRRRRNRKRSRSTVPSHYPTTHVHTYRHMAREAGNTRAHIFTHAHTPSRTRTHILTRAHTRMRAQIFTAGALKSKAQAAAKKPLIQGSLRGPGGGRERWRGVDRGGREQDQTWAHKRIHIRTYKETYKDTYANKTI